VAEEIVSNPGSVWPDAHAVTFWAHHW
jgi:endo-alpha-1,4-polygalactosaminidase (GH114 family)